MYSVYIYVRHCYPCFLRVLLSPFETSHHSSWNCYPVLWNISPSLLKLLSNPPETSLRPMETSLQSWNFFSWNLSQILLKQLSHPPETLLQSSWNFCWLLSRPLSSPFSILFQAAIQSSRGCYPVLLKLLSNPLETINQGYPDSEGEEKSYRCVPCFRWDVRGR